MPIIETIKGDLLDSKEEYIAQQCNCLTVTPHGLSQSIAKRFPYAAVYASRTPIKPGRNCATKLDQSEPGTVQIMMPTKELGPKVICMFAQWTPGKCNKYNNYYPQDYNDTSNNRQQWFQQCLKVIDDDDSITRVGMPYLIGCGLAGGKWETYETMLNNAKTDIVLYCI